MIRMTQAASARQRRRQSVDRSPTSGRYPDQQTAGLRALTELGEQEAAGVRHASAVHPLPVGADRHHRRDDRPDSHRRAPVLPAREESAGSLARYYEIPEITFRPRRWLALLPVAAITCGSIYLHQADALTRVIADPALLGTWAVTLAFIVLQLVLAWSQKPATVSPRQQAALDQLYVTVVIPCYNEDPRILDRTIVSLLRQTRLPDHIEVVDDGSTVDYSAVRGFWLAQRLPTVRFTWVRQRNAGKKHAQAVTFTSDRHADIFVTIDSDSALDRHAISEGLKPFADSRVVSVAGLETAINIDRNLLTRAIGHRSLVFQLFAMSAQSVARGSVLINPGAFSLYRAPMIRKIVPSYLGETFFGVPVTLGDDTALTLYALLHGRAVHQPTAVSLPVYPETLAHHLRQWTRWMRASTIRMLWRLRYLPVLSYGWIFTLYTIGSFLFSVAMTIAIPLAWPGSEKLLLASLAAMVIWPLSIALRLATVRRSDQGAGSRMIGVALLPFAALWYVLVLRQIRFYGIATCWRQGWVTRQHVEVTLDGSHASARARRMQEAVGYERINADQRRAQEQCLPDRGGTERAAAERWPAAEFQPGGRARPPQDPRAMNRHPGQHPAQRQDLRNGRDPRGFPGPRAPGRPPAAPSARPQGAPSARPSAQFWASQENRWPPPARSVPPARSLPPPRSAQPMPPVPPRSPVRPRDLPAGHGPPSRGPSLPPVMDPGRGHSGQPARDARPGREGSGSRRDAFFGRDGRLTADGGLPPDPRYPADPRHPPDPRGATRQGWAALDERTRRDPRDHNGGYAKEHRP
jgi:hyaluronan synthase